MLCFSFHTHKDKENPNKSLLQGRQESPVPQANQQLALTLAAPDCFQPQLLLSSALPGPPPGPASQPGPAAEEELREARKHSPLGCTAGVRLARPLALPTAAPAGCCVSPRYLPGAQFFCSAGAVIPCYTKGWMCLLSITVTGPFSV